MIRTVLFDLDGTLLDRDASIRPFVEDQHRRLAQQLGHIPRQTYVARWVELDCRGHVWKDQVYQQLVHEFDIAGFSWQELLHDYEAEFAFHCVPFPGLVETLSILRQRYSLGIITNGRGVFQTRALLGLKINDFFEAVLVSETEQIRKPQIEIFHRALHRLNATDSTTAFVGDDPHADISGAKNAGLKAIWKRHAFCPEPQNADAIIKELDELPALLGKP